MKPNPVTTDLESVTESQTDIPCPICSRMCVASLDAMTGILLVGCEQFGDHAFLLEAATIAAARLRMLRLGLKT